MNIVKMLMMKVEPLFDKPAGEPRECANPGNQKKRENSRRRMETALPEGEWVAGAEIAKRLGTTVDSSNKTLQMFRTLGEIESRPINPGKGRNLEWRWVE